MATISGRVFGLGRDMSVRPRLSGLLLSARGGRGKLRGGHSLAGFVLTRLSDGLSSLSWGFLSRRHVCRRVSELMSR